MYKLTEKENLLRLYSGEIPEYIPHYDFFGWGAGLPIVQEAGPDGKIRDEFGVEMSTSKESMGGYMPTPGFILLDDITKWRDVVKTPDLSNVDWEALANDALKGKDWEHKPVIVHNMGYFITLMNMMGFVNGLCAMSEEPEEVYALFDYLCEYYCKRAEALVKYFHADVYSLADDTAALQAPFISPETYRNLVKPFHKREADIALNAGLKVQMHCCGHSEAFIDDWLDLGVCAWDPAQVTNDLVGVKKKYQGKLTIIGGWDNQGPISYPNTPDDELRDALKTYVDTMAPNGGFAFYANVVGAPGEEAYDRKMKLINDFYDDYVKDWYKTH